MNRLLLIPICCALVACATTLSQRASMVKIATREEVKGYKFLGTITGSSSLSGVARNTGYENAVNEVLEKAAARGATHVVIEGDGEGRYWVMNQHVRAEAYRAP